MDPICTGTNSTCIERTTVMLIHEVDGDDL
jgi:hypothetical protein